MKIIKVENCLDCPLVARCKKWKALTAKQRFAIKCGNGVRVGVLKGCPLEDMPESKPAEETQWKPIETAEKIYGRKILCYGDGYVFEAECEEDDGYGWWCSIGGTQPTHWMELPQPPASTGEA